jgi:integrase
VAGTVATFRPVNTATPVQEVVAMSEANSTAKPVPSKPSKPYPEFPLTAHPAGYWCKKIKGKIHYFGPWADPDGALARYLEQKDDLHAGRKPRPDADGLTVKELCNAFLNAKQAKVDAGELSPLTWRKYKHVCDLLVSQLGRTRLVADVRADDFAAIRDRMTRSWGPLRVRDFVQHIRSVFKFGFDAELMKVPMRFGPGFARPTKKVIRLHKAKQGPKLLAAEEIRRMLDAAGIPLRAMLLLAINCGFGNSDISKLPFSAVDLETGWIDHVRPKTGVPRRCPLWPETIQAIHDALAKRHEPKNPEHAGLVFVTKYGDAWVKGTGDDAINKETAKLLKKLGINGRKGLGLYTLRHVFRTVADEARDQPAVDHVMGHEIANMSAVYRERISDERLKAVTDHVRTWLFPPAKPAGLESAPTPSVE